MLLLEPTQISTTQHNTTRIGTMQHNTATTRTVYPLTTPFWSPFRVLGKGSALLVCDRYRKYDAMRHGTHYTNRSKVYLEADTKARAGGTVRTGMCGAVRYGTLVGGARTVLYAPGTLGGTAHGFDRSDAAIIDGIVRVRVRTSTAYCIVLYCIVFRRTKQHHPTRTIPRIRSIVGRTYW